MIYIGHFTHLNKRMVPFTLIHFIFIVSMLPVNTFGQMYTMVDVQPDELSALPRWCQIRLIAHPRIAGYPAGENVPDSVMQENAKWENIIGKDIYRSCHHYCWGLNWINRYKISLILTGKQAEAYRNSALNRALAEFYYLHGLKDKVKKHELYDQLLINEAYIYTQLGDIKKAAERYVELKKRNMKH
jgi:hypothetical protein